MRVYVDIRYQMGSDLSISRGNIFLIALEKNRIDRLINNNKYNKGK
jgi:hypothetical protein